MSKEKETILEFFEVGKLYQNKFDETTFFILLEPIKRTSHYGYTIYTMKVLTKNCVKINEIGDKSLLFANPKFYCNKVE